MYLSVLFILKLGSIQVAQDDLKLEPYDPPASVSWVAWNIIVPWAKYEQLRWLWGQECAHPKGGLRCPWVSICKVSDCGECQPSSVWLLLLLLFPSTLRWCFTLILLLSDLKNTAPSREVACLPRTLGNPPGPCSYAILRHLPLPTHFIVPGHHLPVQGSLGTVLSGVSLAKKASQAGFCPPHKSPQAWSLTVYCNIVAEWTSASKVNIKIWSGLPKNYLQHH